jgi:hypothetical protein
MAVYRFAGPPQRCVTASGRVETLEDLGALSVERVQKLWPNEHGNAVAQQMQAWAEERARERNMTPAQRTRRFMNELVADDIERRIRPRAVNGRHGHHDGRRNGTRPDDDEFTIVEGRDGRWRRIG